MYDVTIRCPGAPSGHALGSLLEALVEANADWYLDQWGVGNRPATSAAEAGVRYRSHAFRSSETWRGAAEILKTPRAGYSCQEIAALDAGAMRASALWAGESREDARRRYCAWVEEHGPKDWHALVVTPNGYRDPTEELRAA